MIFFINGHKNTNKQNIINNNDTGLSRNIDHEPLLIIRDLLKFSSKTGPNINPNASGACGKFTRKKTYPTKPKKIITYTSEIKFLIAKEPEIHKTIILILTIFLGEFRSLTMNLIIISPNISVKNIAIKSELYTYDTKPGLS
ncbi:MAG: hypothetical protein QF864_16965, partial [SAR202 cluster bacterium]|nr:hypothetical protein [SAR202 cluster bacterium]